MSDADERTAHIHLQVTPEVKNLLVKAANLSEYKKLNVLVETAAIERAREILRNVK